MSRVFFILPVLLILLTVSSCSNRPGYVISRGKMVDVLYDIQLAQAVYNEYNTKIDTKEKKEALINDVLIKHNITQAELDSSILWYSDNIKLYMEINDSVSSKLKKMRDAHTDLINKRKGRDSYDVLPPLFYLDNAVPILSFRIDSAKLKNIKADHFLWSFDAMGVMEEDTLFAAALYTYADTVVNDIIHITKNDRYVFNKPLLPDSLLKNISGYIRLKKNSPSNVFLYNINYLDSMVVHTPDSLKKEESVAAVPPQTAVVEKSKRMEVVKEISLPDSLKNKEPVTTLPPQATLPAKRKSLEAVKVLDKASKDSLVLIREH